MQTVEAIKYQALMMGIETGRMPEVEFIWSVQKSEGGQMCFGQGFDCDKSGCRWLKQCKALDLYRDKPGD